METQERRTVAIDIDGVIAEVREDLRYDLCDPIPGARESLARLRDLGFRLTLHTARHYNRLEDTTAWLERHGIPYDHLVMGKPTAFCYIDDRGLRFEGDWEETLAKIDGLVGRARGAEA